MRKRTFFAVLLTLLLCSAASALTLEDVIYMSSAGVDNSVILAKIDASGTVFDLSAREIVALWEAGVGPEVIEHMIATAAGPYEERGDYEESYEDYDDAYDDNARVVGHAGTRVHLYFGLGYYDDGWYYPYWSWYRPYYHRYYSYGYGGYWPYYYYWNPYAYYYPWDCWSYGRGGHTVVGRGMRDHWRRSGRGEDTYYGHSGYRLKPRYSRSGGSGGGYLAGNGRYVFPRDKNGREYLGTHRGYRKPPAYGGRTGADYGNRGSSRYGDVRTVRSKPRSGDVTRARTSKDGRYQGTRYKRSPTRASTPNRIERSKRGTSSPSKRSGVSSSRSRSGSSRSSVGGSRSSGSRGSKSGSSGSSRGSSRGSSSGSSRGGRSK